MQILEGWGGGTFGLVLFDLGNKNDQCGIEFAGQGRFRRFFIDDPGTERLVGLSERLDGCQNVGVHSGGLEGARLGERESEGGQELVEGGGEVPGELFSETQW